MRDQEILDCLDRVYEASYSLCQCLEKYQHIFKELGVRPLEQMGLSEKVKLANAILDIQSS